MKKARTISMGFPSGNFYMHLWEGTEDETSFPIKCLKRGKPYVLAYGIKHYLTDKEVKVLRQMQGL